MTAVSAELKRAMTARGLNQRQLADATGISRTTIQGARAGTSVPSQSIAVILAEALDWPNLARLAALDRQGTCVLCGAAFQRSEHVTVQSYCGRKCARAAHARGQRERSRTKALTETRMTRKRLNDHQEAVLAFCRGCEPEGLCRDSECPLRPVSPLPLADARLRVA